jgi:hypothetical protein
VKVWSPNEIKSLKKDVGIIVCILEKKFPPTFFDIMIHLLLHVVEELNVCELVHSHWMYPIERMMKVLKGYVRNMSQLERSMVEGYVLDETMGFVTKYLQEFQHVSKRIWDVEEEEGMVIEVLEGVIEKVVFNSILRNLAQIMC